VITKLNLATSPFRNRTTPYLMSMLLLAFALGGALLCFAKLNKNITANEIAKSDIKRMEAEMADLRGKGEQIRQQLSPQDKELLVAAHKLVDSKSFVWSRLFSDLESVLPGNVSASRIAVQNIYPDGDRVKAELELGVLSRDYQSVMGMVASMNNSGIFQAELRKQDLQSNERSSFTEYTLRLIYTPPYATSPAQSTDVAQAAQEGGQQ
jgi:Tfp pilus assembly protein PilN